MRVEPYEAGQAARTQRHQRVDGAARVAFGPAGLVDLYQLAPCRMRFRDVEPGEPMPAASITTTGGLPGGADIAPTGRLLAVESLVFGRTAMDETLRTRAGQVLPSSTKPTPAQSIPG